jgi:hypothetical protein
LVILDKDLCSAGKLVSKSGKSGQTHNKKQTADKKKEYKSNTVLAQLSCTEKIKHIVCTESLHTKKQTLF